VAVVRQTVYRAVALLLSILFALLIPEVVLRVMVHLDRMRHGDLKQRLERSQSEPLSADAHLSMSGLAQPSANTDIVYELKPGLDGIFCGQRLRTNSRGMRYRESPVEKPADTYRIVGLGDSVMFGWGVDQDQTYLALLEQRLNALPGTHRRFEVLNFAVPGYNTTMEVATFEQKALPFNPDLVVIQFVSNDFDVPYFMQRPDDGLSWRRSYLLDLIRVRLGWLKAATNDQLVEAGLEGLGEGQQREVLDQYRHMVGTDAYRRAMERLAALTRPRDIPVLVILGKGAPGQREVIDEVAAQNGFRLVEAKPYTDAYIRRQGIPDTKEARQKALWVSATDRHPNAAGHAIYADLLMDELIRIGVVEATPRLPAP
jgi:lysophospholipase L1-like esterase